MTRSFQVPRFPVFTVVVLMLAVLATSPAEAVSTEEASPFKLAADVIRGLQEWLFDDAPKKTDTDEEVPGVGEGDADREAGQAFRDCADCPEMVVAPDGTYAVGVYQVTRGEWAAFVRATGYSSGNSCWTYEKGDSKEPSEERSGRSWRNPGFSQTDRHPVVCVNWHDAQAYVRWLSEKTGQAYRLLTGAEWAGVTRGSERGSQCKYANGADRSFARSYPGLSTTAQCDDGYVWTSPVGSYAPNEQGVYDVPGNVWEWVEDCWDKDRSGLLAFFLDCSKRVLRGGSFVDNVEHSVRFDADGSRAFHHGFRLARTLTALAGESRAREWNPERGSQCEYANGADRSFDGTHPGLLLTAQCDDGYVWTSPVGSYAPNGQGVYDVLGNVSEWGEDCSEKDCSLRAAHGGSFYSNPEELRSADSGRLDTDGRAFVLGFRLARTLEGRSGVGETGRSDPSARAGESHTRKGDATWEAGQVFRDCADCPEMVVAPGRSYAVGVYEVTRGEWAAFVRTTGYSYGNSCWTDEDDEVKERSGRSWRNPGFSQTDRHPVVCVNWHDAQAYVGWLSEKTGQAYRLLTEAEWADVARGTAREAGQVFRDCADCPEMVVVAPTPDRIYAVGVYEVTRREWAEFVRTTRYLYEDSCWTYENGEAKKRRRRSWHNPGFSQTNRHPVVCINWHDAQAYVRWLSEKTGQAYRLLTGAEWAGVTRGSERGSQCKYANGADRSFARSYPGLSTTAQCDDGYVWTSPVGSYAPNEQGVYDVPGNVWEWGENCSDTGGSGLTDFLQYGFAMFFRDCSSGLRVLRGGAWRSGPERLRSANRSGSDPGDRFNYVGFRLARTLTP